MKCGKCIYYRYGIDGIYCFLSSPPIKVGTSGGAPTENAEWCVKEGIYSNDFKVNSK